MHLTWLSLPLAIVPVLLWLRACTRPLTAQPKQERCETTAYARRLAFEIDRLARTRPDAVRSGHEQAERWFDQRPFRC